MALTAKQIADLNKSMVANQNVGMGDLISEAGDDIDTLETLLAGVVTGDLALLTRMVGDVTFVIGAESTNVINVGLQFLNGAGDAIATPSGVFAYLSDDTDGSSVASAAPDGGVAIGTDGLAIPIVAGKAFQLVSESDGDTDIDITESGVATWYLVVVLPNGDLVISSAITFA